MRQRITRPTTTLAGPLSCLHLQVRMAMLSGLGLDSRMSGRDHGNRRRPDESLSQLGRC